MKQKDINKLVEKFLAGETTAQEESLLKSRLQSGDAPDELKALRSYFDALSEMEQESLDAAFDEILMNRIATDNPERKSRLWIYTVTSVAAAAALLLAVWMGTNLLKPKEVYGTVNDPKIAFAETKKILFEVSAKLNDGLVPAKKTMNAVEKNMKKAGEVKKLNEVLQKVGYIIKVERINDLLKPVKHEKRKNGKRKIIKS